MPPALGFRARLWFQPGNENANQTDVVKVRAAEAGACKVAQVHLRATWAEPIYINKSWRSAVVCLPAGKVPGCLRSNPGTGQSRSSG